jgi:hypothetical protein
MVDGTCPIHTVLEIVTNLMDDFTVLCTPKYYNIHCIVKYEFLRTSQQHLFILHKHE